MKSSEPGSAKSLVLGAGSWGTALALLVANNGHFVYLWSHDETQMNEMTASRSNAQYFPGITFPSNLQPISDLSLALSEVEDIILAVPSQGFSETVLKIKPYLKAEHRLVIATKGLDPVSGNFLTDSIESILACPVEVGVLSGPTFALEVVAGQPSAITLASLSDNLALHVTALLHNLYFRVYRTTDIKGVQVGGAVKNVLAIAAGIAEGLGFGANAQSALITRGLAEMVRLGLALGGRLETFLGLAGVGDLILTSTSNQSRNRRFGLLVGQGKSVAEAEQQIQQVVEGIHNVKQVCELATKHQVEMPIAFSVEGIVQGKISAKEAVHQLLMRSPKIENL